MSPANTSFLVDALKYNIGANTEDRLTAIVTSSFNHSANFRRAFCRFIKIKYSKALAASQQHSGKTSRVDIVIKQANGEIITVIESKVEAELDKAQLKNHSSIPAKYHYFISKYSVEKSKMPDGWLSLQWRDLAEEVSHFKKDFICNEVLIYLKENKMIPPADLQLSDVEKCAKLLNTIRYHINPELSNLLTNLESINKVAAMLQFAVREIITEEKKFAGKSPKVKLTHFYNNQILLKQISKKKKKTSADLKNMHSYANIGLAIYFDLNGKSKPFLALRLASELGIAWGKSNKISNEGEIIAGFFQNNWAYEDEVVMKFKKGKLGLKELKTQVKSVWL